jgi:CelD/BcsL family acetyltransferase involved in cellulose biosynthesis
MRFSISHQHRVLQKRHQLTLRQSGSEAESLQWLRVLAAWQKTRWSDRGIQGKFEIEKRRRFYESFVSAIFRVSTLSFWAMFADDRLVALELGCRFRAQYIGIHPSFDPDLASCSPGVVLRALVLQKLIEQGTRRYDFGAGDETYKVRWANEVRSFSNFSCAPRWSRQGFKLQCNNGIEEARIFLKRVLPSTIFGAVRYVYHLAKRLFIRNAS